MTKKLGGVRPCLLGIRIGDGEEVLVDWDKEETEFPAGTAKGVAKDNWQTSEGC